MDREVCAICDHYVPAEWTSILDDGNRRYRVPVCEGCLEEYKITEIKEKEDAIH